MERVDKMRRYKFSTKEKLLLLPLFLVAVWLWGSFLETNTWSRFLQFVSHDDDTRKWIELGFIVVSSVMLYGVAVSLFGPARDSYWRDRPPDDE